VVFYYLIGKADFPYENLSLNPVLFRALIEGWIFTSVLSIFWVFVWALLSEKLNEVLNGVSFLRHNRDDHDITIFMIALTF